MKAIIVFISLLLISACGPSKEEICVSKGGVYKYTYTIFIPQKINNVTIIQQYPQYECVFTTGEIEK